MIQKSAMLADEVTECLSFSTTARPITKERCSQMSSNVSSNYADNMLDFSVLNSFEDMPHSVAQTLDCDAQYLIDLTN